MAAEIDRPDLITDGALRAPYDLGEGFTVAEKDLDKLIVTIQKYEKLNEEQTVTVNKLLKRIDLLEKEQKTLTNTVKKLTDEVKKNKKATEEQAKAMEALDNRVGGAITRFRTLGKELLAIAKSPVILVLGTIIALMAALASSVKTFFDTTGEGEDFLDEQTAVWKQFFNSIRNGWANLGRDITKFFGDDVSKKVINGLITYAKMVTTFVPFARKLLNLIEESFNKTAEEAIRLAKINDGVADRMIANIIVEAKTREEVNKLILKSGDEIAYTDAQRLGFLQEAIDLQEAQLRINVKLAKEQSVALLKEIGLRHDLLAEQTLALTQAEKNALFTEEENRQLAEAIAKIITLEGDYYQEVRKNANRIVALKQQIHKKDIEAAEKAAAARIQAARDELNDQIQQIKNQVVTGNKYKTEAEKEIEDLRRKTAASLVAVEIEALNTILAKDNLTKEERAKYSQDLYNLETKLNEAYYESFKDNQEKALEVLKTVKQQYEAFAGSINSIFQGMTDRRLQELDKQEKANEEMLERQLEAAGNNEEAKKKIEESAAKRQERLEKQRVALLRRAAIFEKAIAVAQATINTAVAVTALLETPPLAIAAGIAGALQVAAILAQPLPAYKDGGITDTPYVLAGEEGIEGYKTPGGKHGFTPDGPTVMKLPVGTEIFSHNDTMKAVAMSGMDSTLGTRQDAMLLKAFIKGVDDLRHEMRNKKEIHINFSTRGAEASLKNSENWTKLLNDYYA